VSINFRYSVTSSLIGSRVVLVDSSELDSSSVSVIGSLEWVLSPYQSSICYISSALMKNIIELSSASWLCKGLSALLQFVMSSNSP